MPIKSPLQHVHLKLAVTIVLLFSLFSIFTATTACSNTAPATVSHPGAINTFDSATYATLISAQAAIEKAKTLVPSTPGMKAPLNAVISAYNPAEAAWQAYHASGGAGDTTSVQKLVDQLKLALAPLIKMIGGNL